MRREEKNRWDVGVGGSPASSDPSAPATQQRAGDNHHTWRRDATHFSRRGATGMAHRRLSAEEDVRL